MPPRKDFLKPEQWDELYEIFSEVTMLSQEFFCFARKALAEQNKTAFRASRVTSLELLKKLKLWNRRSIDYGV